MPTRIASFTIGALLSAFAVAAAGADAAAGKALTQAQCAECHEDSEWQGESADALVAKIDAVVSGKTKHKNKPKLTPAQIADIAAHWAACCQAPAGK